MITIYGSEKCLQCLRAKQLAEIFELEHEFKSTSSMENYKEFLRLTKHPTYVPQILWDGEMLLGYHRCSERIDNYMLELKKRKTDEQANDC